VLGEPACGFVVGIEPELALALRSLLGSAMGRAMLQTFASSFSFWASAMTFWATCVGTSS
jgi:hypothetical protein